MTRITADLPQPSPEVIAVVGQRAGLGTTTGAVNLALALAAAGRSVLLIDLDISGQATHVLGYDGHGRGGTGQAIREARFARDMLVATRITELYLSPAGEGLGVAATALQTMDDSYTRLYQALATLDDLALDFDHVILDCPPGLDLLTRNALVVAHRVLLPLTGDPDILDGLPTVLTIVSRLRASLPHPFYGVYLLLNGFSVDESGQALIDEVREEYGRMILLSEIPVDEAVREAEASHRPLLLHSSTCAASRAYLELAAEWLTLGQRGDQPDGTWRFGFRRERMTRYRDEMIKGIEGWLIDPSSRVYDGEEAARRQDALALDALFQATRPDGRFGFLKRYRWSILASALVLMLVAPAVLLPWILGSTESWRVELGIWLIGPKDYWRAGSSLLARADENAYRELVLATQLVAENRDRLLVCSERAQEHGIANRCTIAFPSSQDERR